MQWFGLYLFVLKGIIFNGIPTNRAAEGSNPSECGIKQKTRP